MCIFCDGPAADGHCCDGCWARVAGDTAERVDNSWLDRFQERLAG